MNNYKMPLFIIAMGSVLMTVHVMAHLNTLYWRWWWLDIVMHFSGGLLVALFGLWALTRIAPSVIEGSWYTLLFHIMLFSVVIGLVWETSELFFELALAVRPEYVVDTITDFIMNFMDALTGLFIFLHIRSFTNNQELTTKS